MAAAVGASTANQSATSSPRHNSVSSEEKNIKYDLPRSAYYIILVEGCERFCYAGLRVLLLLYFMHFFHEDHNTATVYYHSFLFVCHFTPLFGAILSDGYIGRYLTILILAIVYFIGTVILTITAIPKIGRQQLIGPVIGLLLIAIGTGGIKPTVNAFGADQLLSTNTIQLSRFFSFCYFAINFGSFISSAVTPIIRSDVHCFDYECYSLAFAVPMLLVLGAIILFLMGKPLYKCILPEENIIAKFFGILWRALRNGIFCSTSEAKQHFLDYADDKYSINDIEDVRSVLNVSLLFIPLLVYHALNSQKGSRWTYQASLMDGRVGSLMTIKPDQMQGMNYLLLLLFIPLFERVVYPAAARFNWLIEPLQRIFVGLILTIIAFIVAAILQHIIQTEAKTVPVREHTRIYNGYNCPIYIDHNTILASGKIYQFPCTKLLIEELVVTSVCDKQNVIYKLSEDKICPSMLIVSESNGTIMAATPLTNPVLYNQSVSEFALLRCVSLNNVINSTVKTVPNQYTFNLEQRLVPTEYQSVLDQTYEIRNLANRETSIDSFHVSTTGVYTVLLVNTKENQLRAILFEDIPPHAIHLLWQTIQYALLTCAEILVSITALIVAYTEAPKRYKVVVMSFWLLTSSFGEILVMFVAGARLVADQTLEFLLFALIMTFGTFLYGIVAINYKAKHSRQSVDETSEGQRLLTGRDLAH